MRERIRVNSHFEQDIVHAVNTHDVNSF